MSNIDSWFLSTKSEPGPEFTKICNFNTYKLVKLRVAKSKLKGLIYKEILATRKYDFVRISRWEIPPNRERILVTSLYATQSSPW